MPTKDRDISQNLLDDDYPRIHLQENISEFKLPKEFFDEFFEGYPSQRVVGLAPIYSATGNLTQLAIGVKTRVTVIKFANRGKNATYHGRDLLATELLCHPDVTLVAFDLDKLAVALFVDLKIRITNGVDLQSACGMDRTPLAAIKYAACDCVPVQEENVKKLFDCKNIMGQTRTAMNAALQAWVAQCISSMNVMDERVRSAKKIATQDRPDEHVRSAIPCPIVQWISPVSSRDCVLWCRLPGLFTAPSSFEPTKPLTSSMLSMFATRLRMSALTASIAGSSRVL